jgi:hypothetical protein
VDGTRATLFVELAGGISVTLSFDCAPRSWTCSCAAAGCFSSSGFFLLLGGTEDLEDE